MIGTRHEEYGHSYDRLPFILHPNLERTPFNCSREQNWHEDLEIQLCTEGQGRVLINGEKYPFLKNDIAVIESNAIHYTGTEEHLTYTCLIIGAVFCRQVGIDYDALEFTPVFKSSRMTALLTELTDIYTDPACPLRVAKLYGVLLRLLVELVEHHSTEKSRLLLKRKSFENVKSAVRYIRDNYVEQLTLDKIARAVCADKFALCRDFKKLTGQTISEYINHYRCQMAADCIREGSTVAEAAQMCGFRNHSYFTRTFQKYMGALPSVYKCR